MSVMDTAAVLNPDQGLAEHLDIRAIIDEVRTGHLDLDSGLAVQPPRHVVEVPGSPVALVPMVAASARWGLAVVKTLIDLPTNAAVGLPVQQSTIQVFDLGTGRCLATLAGRDITRCRTAAASAVATDALANPGASRLGLVGAGALARTHLEAIATVRRIDRVTVWSRTRATAEGFAAEARGRGHVVEVVDTVEQVAESSDIICTLTPSREPVLRGSWLRPGQHVNAVGAPPRPDHRELDTEAITRASLVVVDTVDTALTESGDVLIPLKEGAIAREALRTELGAVLAGTAPGRRHADDITIFDSVGVGIQDLAAVSWLLRQQGLLPPAHPGAAPRA